MWEGVGISPGFDFMATAPPKLIALAAAASACAALLWVVLAWRTPTSTYHFAPLVASAIGPYVVRQKADRLDTPSAMSVAAISAIVVAAATVALAAGERLQGPTFWSDAGALTETVIFTIVGGAVGFALTVKSPWTTPAPH